ncbi:hypothetical protein OHA25_13410 [Nonomuraea sp. NBC_00507]|uniref:sigma factor-like helix-turn-helix DNA-binding protein n=1 Tax=Nonomuraea sp. NBC_00507 TaxID=2976002 RepID=UPI002E17132B
MTQADPAALWQQMRERLVAFVAHRIDQPADAEDIVQEVLPEPYREAIVLTEYEGLTQAEAAQRARISVPGMKSRVQRARRQLGDLLTACCQVELDARKAVRSVENRGPCPC